MPRSPRVQYEYAVYHVMARGNRREAIVHDDGDRQLFLDTFAEACGRTAERGEGVETVEEACGVKPVDSTRQIRRFLPRFPEPAQESKVNHLG